ncbi:hypothetical protein [uncultured Vibrio sp.]|uniref:hypothetical protein n=1 Tax=uncultured Vibrio sp. TaxID=114054 RepID=UPI00261A00A3|nr:hypothetical protein [uncultured Vibrio sp.]
MGCSSNQDLLSAPTTITLFDGDTSISAGVLEDKTFHSVLANRKERITFSGSISKQSSGYLVDMLVIRIREDKTGQAFRQFDQLDTSIYMEQGKLVVLGYDKFKVILE